MLVVTGVINYPTAAKEYIKSVQDQLQEEFPNSITTVSDNTIQFDANLQDAVEEFLERTFCSLDVIIKRPKDVETTATNGGHYTDGRYYD